MIAKEWWEARWKFFVAAAVFLAIVAFAPRTFEGIKADIQQEIKWAQDEKFNDYESYSVGSLEEGPVGPGMEKKISEKQRLQFERENQRLIESLSRPEYVVKQAKWEINYHQQFASFGILLPLAGLLGVALVSGEVSRSSILLLLSKPMSRDRMLLTKYAVGVVCLFVVALLGGIGIILSALLRGYPLASVEVGWIMVSAALIWLGSLFVLGVALLASVMFKDVLKTLIATIVAVYLSISIPDILRIPLTIFWTDGYGTQSWAKVEKWYEYFEVFRLTNHWSIGSLYGPLYGGQQVSPWLSVAVCLVTAAIPVLAALWLFRRKTY
jgi:ABC-type transport system involved in multi-copper enzyme maturation permease subunit